MYTKPNADDVPPLSIWTGVTEGLDWAHLVKGRPWDAALPSSLSDARLRQLVDDLSELPPYEHSSVILMCHLFGVHDSPNGAGFLADLNVDFKVSNAYKRAAAEELANRRGFPVGDSGSRDLHAMVAKAKAVIDATAASPARTAFPPRRLVDDDATKSALSMIDRQNQLAERMRSNYFGTSVGKSDHSPTVASDARRPSS